MPHVCPRLPAELHIELIRQREAGKKVDAIADALELNPATVTKWTAHVLDGRKSDLVKKSILARAEAGEDVRTIASLENCTIYFVVCLLRSWAGELDAWERLSLMKSPRRKRAPQGQRPQEQRPSDDAPTTAIVPVPTPPRERKPRAPTTAIVPVPTPPRERKPRAPNLTHAAIIEIREFAASGISDAEIAETYGVTTKGVQEIRTGRAHADLPGPRTRKRAPSLPR